MKIIDRETFLKLPAGTVYSKYEPCVFGDLCIKGDSLKNDWAYQSIVDAIDAIDSPVFSDKLFLSEKTGESIDMDFYCMVRDGLFENDQLFSVWDKKDVIALMNRLSETITR